MVRALIGFRNRRVGVAGIPQRLTNEYNWSSNKEAVSIIDKLVQGIEDVSSYKIVLPIIGDKNLIKYYQHYLA